MKTFNKSLQSLLLFTTIIGQVSAVEISASPISRTVEDAHHNLDQRLAILAEHFASAPIPDFQFKGPDPVGPMIGRILTGKNLHEVNAKLILPSSRQTSEVGTDFDGVLGACTRKGDYDFTLTSLVAMTYLGLERNVFTAEAYQKLLRDLLTIRGNQHQTSITICVKVPETENHILMIESARYLTNQLLLKQEPGNALYDNEKNGFNAWLTRHLQQFLKKDFEEFNSRPYQGYAIMPLLNLASYAQDSRVASAATMVLDYLMAKYVAQSSQLRRSSPICRQGEYAVRPELLPGDHMSAIMATLVGNTRIFAANTPPGHITYAEFTGMVAGMSKYRIPDMIMDMILTPDQVLELRVRHDAVESYYRHPKFLLTAGGQYLNRFDAGMGKRDGHAYPTSVIPEQGMELNRNQLLRFEGTYRENYRNNMCQYRNFACGMNLRMPEGLPESCITRKNGWTFINYQSDQCPLKYGYYVAIFTARYPAPGLLARRFASDYGLFEVQDADGVSFDHFVATTLQRNQGRRYVHFGKNQYTTYAGDTIEFNPGNANLNFSPISGVNGRPPFTEAYKGWTFLSGNYLQGAGDGLVRVLNPKLRKMLELDYRNPLNPQRTEADY